MTVRALRLGMVKVRNGSFPDLGCSYALHPRSRNMMTPNFSRRAHHNNLCEQTGHIWMKGSSYGDVHSHVNYEGRRKIPAKHPRRKNEMGGIPWLRGLKKVLVTVSG